MSVMLACFAFLVSLAIITFSYLEVSPADRKQGFPILQDDEKQPGGSGKRRRG